MSLKLSTGDDCSSNIFKGTILGEKLALEVMVITAHSTGETIDEKNSIMLSIIPNLVNSVINFVADEFGPDRKTVLETVVTAIYERATHDSLHNSR